MTDYSKQTVAQLRQLLKERHIPGTGLTRKAQIIERLQESENAAAGACDGPDAPAPAPAPAPTQASHSEDDAPLSESTEAKEHGVEEVSESEDKSMEPQEQPKEQPVEVEEKSIGGKEHTVEEPMEEKIESAEAKEHTVEETMEARMESIGEKENSVDESVQAKEQPLEESSETKEISVEEPMETEEPVTGPSKLEDKVISQDIEPTHTETGDAKENLPDASQDTDLSKDRKDVERKEQNISAQDEQTSRLNTEELEVDSRKRKRRSHSPDQQLQDIKAKKRRPSLDTAPGVHLKEDNDFAREPGRLEDSMADALPSEADSKREKKENISRYKNLVTADSEDTPMNALTDDRPTIPALHPVTSALYISNLMRPLRPELVQAHLVSIASPPSTSPDPSIIKALFLDAMKTHALVLFSSTIAASRVRASLHGSIWPPEGNRKELWVDFIPDDRVQDWIKEEEDAILADKEARAAGRSVLPKRFEVLYTPQEDGPVTAIFQQVGSKALANVPRGPRADIHFHRPSDQPLPTPTLPSVDMRHDIEASFKTLDELFSSTVAKPQLFFLPVSDEISERRLKELDLETSRDWAPDETRKGRGMKIEMKYRYTFDEEDRIVELGEDRGPWSEGYAGRGGYRGRPRGRGGYRGGGDSWRG